MVVLLLLFRCNSERPTSVPDVFRSHFFSDRFKVIEQKMYALQFPQALHKLEQLINQSELPASEQKYAYLQAAFLNLSLEKTKRGFAWIRRFHKTFPDSSRWSTAVKAHYHLVKGMAEYQELKLFEAKEEFLKAIPLLQKVYTNNHYYVAVGLTQMGLVLFDIDYTQVTTNDFLRRAEEIYHYYPELDHLGWECFLGKAQQNLNDRALQKAHAMLLRALYLYQSSNLNLPIFHGRCMIMLGNVLKKTEDTAPNHGRGYMTADSCFGKAMWLLVPSGSIRLQELYRDWILLDSRLKGSQIRIDFHRNKLLRWVKKQGTDVFAFVDRLDGYCAYSKVRVDPATYQSPANSKNIHAVILALNVFLQVNARNPYHNRHLDEVYFLLLHSYAALGEYQEALKICRRSIELFHDTTKIQPYHTVLECHIDKTQVAAWVMSGKLGNLYLHWAKKSPSKFKFVLIKRAIDIFELFDQHFFSSILTSEEDALSTFQYEVANIIYPSALESCYLYYQFSKQQKYLDLAFRFCERRKAYQLYRDMLKANVEKKGSSTDSIRYLQSEWNKLYFTICDPKKISANVLKKIATVDYQLQKSLLQLNRDSALYQKNVVQPITNIASIQQKLKPNQQLVNYVLDDQQRLYIFAVHRKSTKLIKVEANNIDSLIARLFTYLHYTGFPNKAQSSDYINTATQLYNLLLKPLEGFLTSQYTTIIIPDQILHVLPFECLLKHRPGTSQILNFKNLPYFLYDGPILYSSSWKVYVEKSERELNKPYSDGELWIAKDVESSAAIKHALSKFFQHKYHIWEGDQCNRKNFLAKVSEFKGLVHLSVHAESSMKNRMDNKLKFPSKIPEDGWLYGFDLGGLSLSKIDLLVLAACQSSYGQTNGEGAYSLARFFSQAGVGGVIGTLWEVDNGTTNQVLNRLYYYLSKNHPPEMALWLGKIDFIQKERFNFPGTWSGVVLIR